MKPAQDTANKQIPNNQISNAKSIQDDLDALTKNPVPTLSEEITAEFGGKGREPVKIGEEIPTHIEHEKHKELITDGYIEKVEKEAQLMIPVRDDNTQKVLLQSSTPQKPKIKLPLSEGQIEEGLHHKIWESIRWLAEWCKRQVEILYT